MKWLAIVALTLNVGVWYFSGAFEPAQRSGVVASGNLPRVASLKASSPKSTGGVAPLSTVEGLSCVRVGWIDSPDAAEALIDRQPLAKELGFTVHDVERELPALHWVIIPPQPPEVARRKFRDIQRQGIDSYLVTEGENRNAISLGLFESREAAKSVLEEKKRQKLNVVLANFPRNQISYALSFEAEPELAKEMVQAVEMDYGRKFDFVEINACESVATPKKNP